MSPRASLVLSAVTMFVIGMCFLQVTAVEQTEQAVRARPDADSLVVYDGVEMTKAHFILEYLVPEQSSIWQRPFYALSRTTRWFLLYILGGLAGGIGAYWLELTGIAKEAATRHWPARLMLSAFAGGVMWLLIRLPGPLLTRLFVSDAVSGARTDNLYPSFVVFAVLAGLFLALFFEKLREFFANSFGKGGKP